MIHWACVDGNEAAARVAHRLSEVIAIYRGSVSQRSVADPTAFERGNYMKLLRSYTSSFQG
jgi:hypothetical protein